MNTFYFRWLLKKLRNIGLLMLFISISSFSVAASQVHNKTTINTQKEFLSISKELSIKELFTYISKKTNYQFFYNSDLKDLNTKVKMEVKKSSVEALLHLAFKNTSLEYTLKGNNIVVRNKTAKKLRSTKIATKKQQQVSTVKGTVLDDTNMPLPGVSIIIKGTSKGTTTDFDGNYEMEANKGDVLVFSYMGFDNQSVTVGNNNTINITMKSSSNMLDEVIIAGVASGTSKKKMSVSVAKIKSDALNTVPQSSISAALAGKLAGVTINSLSGSPGASKQIILRGATNLTGNNSPLILVDGIIMKGSLSDINADDIESVEVVKGSAAASLYGSDAGNGVIVITSKRGRKLTEGQTSFTVRTQLGMQSVSKYLDLAESHYYELAPDWLSVDSYTKYNTVTYPEGYVNGDLLNSTRTVKADHYMDLPYRVNNNLQESMFTDGLTYTNYLRVGHRTEKMNILASFENHANQGIIVETGGYKRNSLRLNLDYRITDKISLGLSNNFIKTHNDYMGGGAYSAFNSILMMEPDVDLFRDNPDGQKYNYFANVWERRIHNPLYSLWSQKSEYNKSRYLGAYNIKYRVNDWVNIKLSYALEKGTYENPYNTPMNILGGISPKEGMNITKILNSNLNGTANFSRSWGDLDFKGKLSYIYEKSWDKRNGDFKTWREKENEEGYEWVYGEKDPFLQEILAEDYFAIASFVYKDRYIFDGLFRNDGSSLFGENERRHNYYRLSGAYRVTKDIAIPGVQELKLRAAYGTAGIRPDFAHQYETYKEINGVLFPHHLGNKNLKPARMTEKEVGMDISFLDRFYLETSYSHAVTEDSFVNVQLLAYAGGFDRQTQNIGTLESNNFEASLNAKLIKKEDFKWNVGVTFDKSKSKILDLGIPAFSIGPGGIFKMKEGKEFGMMYGKDFVHTLTQMEAQLPEGESISDYSVNRDRIVVKTADIGTTREKAFLQLDENGDAKDVEIGNTNPNFNMGFNTNITYKNLSFYTLWKWKNGGDIYNFTAQKLVDNLRHPMMDQIHTKPENKKTVDYYKSLYHNQDKTAFWVEDASYLRLNEASLFYTLNKNSKLLDNIFINNLKVGIVGKNLFVFTDYSGYDPESGSGSFIYDNNRYPNFRSYAISFEFKF